MKKLLGIIAAVLFTSVLVFPVHGAEGEGSFFGGISEGVPLPKEIEKSVTTKASTTTKHTLEYKEVVFISGEPVTFQGTVTITKTNQNKESGTFRETFVIDARDIGNPQNTLRRDIRLNTKYFTKDGTVVRDSELVNKNSWTETITINGKQYVLDRDKSSFTKSGIEDFAGGITYFDTLVNYQAVYNVGNEQVTVLANNTMFGYSQPWSKVDTQFMQLNIDSSEGWVMEVDVKPFIISHKTLSYDTTIPTNISFAGNYHIVHQREASMTYNILTNHPNLTAKQKSGSISISKFNVPEKLAAPKGLEFLTAHWSEADFLKLYSLNIITELPHIGMQYELISRGEFIKQIVLLMNLDTSKYTNTRTLKSQFQVFSDVPKTHPLYPYIMTAYDAGITSGRGNAYGIEQSFAVDSSITREEAFTLAVRAMGLERLGLSSNAITSFRDDSKISSFAKQAIAAGEILGFIKGDTNHNVNPKGNLTKAEAAAFIMNIINFLGEDFSREYRSMY